MIVLTPSVGNQTFSCIPRNNTFNVMELTDEQTNEVFPISIVSTTTGNYVNTITAQFNVVNIELIEGHTYTLELKDMLNNIIFKDKVFCTAQPIVTFSVNNNQYVSNTTTNDFIVYE